MRTPAGAPFEGDTQERVGGVEVMGEGTLQGYIATFFIFSASS